MAALTQVPVAPGRERVRESFLGTRHLVQYMELIEEMLQAERGGGSRSKP